VSDIDKKGDVLNTFTDVNKPEHLAIIDNTGQVIVAVWDTKGNHRILLLNRKLQLESVLISDAQTDFWGPRRLHYRPLTSRLYVLHCLHYMAGWPNVVSEWILE